MEKEYGGEKSGLDILDEAAERLRAAGYQVSINKEYTQREGVITEQCVCAVLRVRQELAN
jgi:hypothetical protein